MTEPLFTLPAEPVDRYTIEWWEVNNDHGVPRIFRHALRYHVNSPFASVADAATVARGAGAPIIDQWLCFTRYRDTDAPWSWADVTGRTTGGWREAFCLDRRRAFATRAGAIAAAIGFATRERERLAASVRELDGFIDRFDPPTQLEAWVRLGRLAGMSDGEARAHAGRLARARRRRASDRAAGEPS